MFKTLDLSKIPLTLNDLRTEFTAVSKNRKLFVGFLNGSRFRFVVDEAQDAENSFQACRTWNKNQKRIGNFLDVFRQIAQDYLRF